jgi:hypothetical protein
MTLPFRSESFISFFGMICDMFTPMVRIGGLDINNYCMVLIFDGDS